MRATATPVQVSTETPPSTDRQVFLKKRMSGLGGSDIGAILGLNPHRTARDVWEEKMGLAVSDEPSGPILRGIHLEPIAAVEYQKATGRDVRRQPQRTHKDHPWAIGNCDRQILATSEKPTGILEIKCPGLHNFTQWKLKGLPETYVLQLQWYMSVFDYTWGAYGIFSAERWDLIHFDVERDDALCKTMLEAGEQFWHDHVLTGIPPEEPEPAKLDLPDTCGELVVQDTPEWKAAVETLLEAKELKDAACDLEDSAKAELQKMMGDSGIVEVPGLVRIYFKTQQGRTSLDEKALVASRPIDREKLISLAAQTVADSPEFMKFVEAINKDCILDIEQFKSRGNPSRPFKLYPLKARGNGE